MSDNQSSTAKDQVAPSEPSVEAVVDNLQVSTPADESAKEVEVTKKIEERNVDDGESETSSDDDGEVPKELGLVISALQDTVKQNQENEILTEKKVENSVEVEEDLHSGDDIDSETKSMTDDNTSVATSASTTVSHEDEKVSHEEKVIEEEKIVHEEEGVEEKNVEELKSTTEGESTAIPQTFQEIVQDILPPTPGVAPQRHNFELSGRASEEVGDVESYSANLIALNKIDTKDIKANNLSPRQQERAGKRRCFFYTLIIWNAYFFFYLGKLDEPVLRAIRHLFNNRFMKAKKLFEKQAETYSNFSF